MKIKQQLPVMAIVMVPIAVSINVIGGQLTNMLKLPIYLDTIGTILMAAIGGPIIGSATAILSTIFNSLLRPQAFAFVFTGIGIALFTSICSHFGLLTTFKKSLVLGAFIAVLSVLISAPIVVILFGGVSGSGTSIVTGILLASGKKFMTSVVTTGLLFGFFDKTLSVLVVYYLIRNLPQRKLVQFPRGILFIEGGKDGLH